MVVDVHSSLEVQQLCAEGGPSPDPNLELVPHLKGTASPQLWLILLVYSFNVSVAKPFSVSKEARNMTFYMKLPKS